MNMYEWIDQTIADRWKKAAPLISYPAAQTLYIPVKEMVKDSTQMAIGMYLIAEHYPQMAFAPSYMDLSVEAEAFGAKTVYSDKDVPTVVGKLIETQEEADALRIPEVGEGRTAKCIETIQKARKLITDRPVFANCAGPFSCAGRLLDVNEILLLTLEDPDMVHTILEKTSAFILAFIKAFKAAGADGVIMAEPLAGLLSPSLMQEFSTDYVRKIVDEVQDECFIVCYHNCANRIESRAEQVAATGARMFHFGEGANMVKLLETMPKDCIIMGNVSPANVFNSSSGPWKMRRATQALMHSCIGFDNFVISSGCDVPGDTDWNNIKQFFLTVELEYKKRMLMDKLSEN